jgi:hypothetical protein
MKMVIMLGASAMAMSHAGLNHHSELKVAR